MSKIHLFTAYVQHTHENVNVDTFLATCIAGHIDIAKWLIERYKKKINILGRYESVFRETCQAGQLDTAKWLITLGEIDIHSQKNGAFRGACASGHVDMAQWLYDFGGIDIHEHYEDPLRRGCRFNHVGIVRWLLEMGVTNPFRQCVLTDAFHYSCMYKHQEIADLLSEFSSEPMPLKLICRYELAFEAVYNGKVGDDDSEIDEW